MDTAILQPFSPGAYTAQVNGANATSGIALAELYDADTGTPTTRLLNISARANVTGGINNLVAGFVITGNSSETVLIRGAGPALAVAPFNLTGALTAPTLTLNNSAGTVIATNSAWGGSAALSAAFSSTGAFPFAAGSNDAAILVTLAPGTYTATVSGAGGATGIGLVEIYEVTVH